MREVYIADKRWRREYYNVFQGQEHLIAGPIDRLEAKNSSRAHGVCSKLTLPEDFSCHLSWGKLFSKLR